MRNSLVGSAVERIEDLRFLRGRGEYVDDVKRDGLLHAAIFRSAHAHGLVKDIDVSRAREMPGVHDVITARDIGDPVPTIPLRLEAISSLSALEQPVIANRKVMYVGQPIALVLASSAALAEDAAAEISVTIEPLPLVADRKGSRAGNAILFEELGTNLALDIAAVCGDTDAAFRDAFYVRKERFKVQRHTGMPMETRGVMAEWDEDKGSITVHGPTKVIFFTRRTLAAQLGLPEAAVNIVESDIGGGFGVRGEFSPEDFLISFAARRHKTAVKWIEDRREHMMTANHARDLECEAEIACREDGTIIGLRVKAEADLGAYVRTAGVTPARNFAQAFSGPYRVPNVRVDVSLLMTNKTPVGAYRAPGRFEADFVRERLFDMAAKDLGIDRVAFRRRNLVPPSLMPYPLPIILPFKGETSCDSGDYEFTLDRCLEDIGWDEIAPLQGQLIDGEYHGAGIGCYIEGGGSGPKENARLVLEKDGAVSIFVGSSGLGQGIETIFAQIAADALELPLSRIKGVYHGSTSHVVEGFGSWGSRSTVMGGSAILAAAANLQQKIREAGAKHLGCQPDDVKVAEGVATYQGTSIGFDRLASDGIAATGSFACDKRTYSYGAHAAHVAVDPKTGRVRVLKYVGVEDVGRIINPATLKGQAVGAIVQGLGGSLLEELVYDEDAQLLTGSLADYLMPTADDFPLIKVSTFERCPSPNNPLGAKGAGEGGVIPVAGVISNAVAAALSSLGVQPRALPLTPSNVWHLIDASRQAQVIGQ